MDTLDVDNVTTEDETTERPELDPDDAPAVLRTTAEDVQDMVDQCVLDKRVLTTLAKIIKWNIDLDALIVERDQEINRLAQQLATLNETMRQLSIYLAEKLNPLAEIMSSMPTLEEALKRVTQLETTVKGLDASVQINNSGLLERGLRITELEATVAELETAITTPAAPPSGAKTKAAAT